MLGDRQCEVSAISVSVRERTKTFLFRNVQKTVSGCLTALDEHGEFRTIKRKFSL
jgi:hypothetical protein